MPSIEAHDSGTCTLRFKSGASCSAEYFLSWNGDEGLMEATIKPSGRVLDHYPSVFSCEAKEYTFSASGLDQYNMPRFEGFESPMTEKRFRDEYSRDLS